MPRFIFRLLLLLCICWCLGTATAFAPGEQLLVSVFDKPVPENTYDLRTLERTARQLGRKLATCTVGVEVDSAHGSGVVIKDGYVLTAGHVIGRPGREAKIRFPDGRTVAGTTLGVHTVADGGLVKITGDGDWPHAELITTRQRPEVGDWCLAMGHPSGFDAQRAPPLRLGRVISIQDNLIQTDCPLMGGDSGGPLFDMRGRVIGINSWITETVTENFHGSVLSHIAAWDALTAGEVYPARPASRFLEALDLDGDGQLTRAELPDGYMKGVFDRLAKQFNLAVDQPHSIRDFTENVLRWRSSSRITFGRQDRQSVLEDALAPEFYVRGTSMRDLFLSIVSPGAKSIARIESDRQWVGMGMVVDSAGLVVTKDSQLGDGLHCLFFDGRKLPAEKVAVDEENDLALLRVQATGLSPVAWSTDEVSPGSWLISPDSMGGVAGVGVMSVGRRRIEKTPAVLGVEIEQVTGSTTVARVQPRSGAAEAGVRAGDQIVKVVDQQVRDLRQLRDALGQYRAGDAVAITVQRGEETVVLEVTLWAPEDVFFRFQTSRMNGPMSRRRDGFQSAIQHDSVLRPTACGGPVLDISGKVVGMNIARANRTATYALPNDVLQSFLNQHRRPTD